MGLNQSIVIVNEYTVPLPGGKGSRGGTPGDYVTRYMAREGATETVAPIRRLQVDRFIERYMAREDATEQLVDGDTRTLKRRMGKAQGSGGVSFGYGQVSLSHDELKNASADIQRLFNEGGTVMKTVLSFDQEYLRKHKLIPEDFVCERRGDYRGKLDQMKLRMAVMRGLERMNNNLYDDLRYVGVIQVDTEHVHCHLAMIDAGEGTLAADGTQKGKINQAAKSMLRRGIDAWLDEKQSVKHLSSAVGYERRNVTTFVKRWAHQQMLRESLPQFLLACLPEDRRLWRSGTNHEAMNKPNRLVHQMVEEVLSRPGSPMGQAMAGVQEYANHRREAENLSTPAWKKLVADGRSQIIERGVNSVYGLLRALPQDALQVRTPMLSAMSMDYEQLGAQAQNPETTDELSSFSFRLRSYATRLEHHTEQRVEYHEKVRAWEVADDSGVAAAASKALYDFYLEEEEYHAKCAAKYRKFLNFTPATAQWYDSWKSVADYGERMLSLESMRKDGSLRKMKDLDEAERLGRDVYGQAGGHLVAQGDAGSLAKLDDRIAKMRIEYVRKVSDLRVELASKGLTLELVPGEIGPAGIQEPDTAVVTAGTEFEFETVKALDLHNMRYDFSSDVEVGPRGRAVFVDQAKVRQRRLDDAVSYLKESGQGSAVSELPVTDVASMSALATQLAAGSKVLPSQVAVLAREREVLRRSRTVRLSDSLSARLDESVFEAVRDVEPLYNEPDSGGSPTRREEGLG